MSEHAQHRAKEQKTAEAYVRRAGYAHGGAVKEGREAKKHEYSSERNYAAKESPKSGGIVGGKKPAERLDKFARGGRHKGGGKVNVNIISAGGGDAEKQQAAAQGMQAGRQQGMQIGAQMGARAMAQRMAGGGGPPAGPPPGAVPPGAGPVARPMPPPGAVPPQGVPPRPPMKRGGALHLKGGAGGYEGRLDKAEHEGSRFTQVRAHKRRLGGSV